MAAQFGSMAKRMQHGFAARNGLFAALLAQGGYTGINSVYETPYGGFLSCFSQGANFEPKSLPGEICKGLGERWEIENIRIKLHASMAALHGTIDCAANLQKRYPGRFADLNTIKSIETRHGRAAFEHGGWKQPEGKPLTSTAAQMSIQYAAAVQLVDGQVLMAQFGADKLNRAEVVALMQKVNPIHDAEFDKDKKDGFRTIMKITFDDGTVVEENVAAWKGISPPVSNEDIVEKYHSLVKDVIDEERMRKIEECVLNLDERDGAVEELCGLLEAEVGKAIEA
jgi:aconitate decarboxylase